MSAELIVSVSGIRDETCYLAAGFADEMDTRGVRLSLLVAPRLKDKYRLADDAVTTAWLRERREHGDAIVLHGYDQAATKRRRSEFSALPRHEARLRLMAADRVILVECDLVSPAGEATTLRFSDRAIRPMSPIAIGGT